MTAAPAIAPFEILGAAFFSTHHASAADVLAARDRPFTTPAYSLLVGRARRFTSLVTQMHIEVCGALSIDTGESADAGGPPLAVFATCHGEIQTAEKLIADFREATMVSSARFALSVHNAASGMYSVAVGSTAATTTVTGANAIAGGWLEAVLTVHELGRPVLLSIADEPVPAIFQGPSATAGVAAAFLLGPAAAGLRAQLAITRRGSPSDGDGDADAELACDVDPATDLANDLANDPAIDPLQVLARVVDAWTRRDPASIALGRIQPGAALELCFLAQATPA